MTDERICDGTVLQWRGKNGTVKGTVRGDEVLTDKTHSFALSDILTSKSLTTVNNESK